jgi:hypothetical protein
MKIPRENTLSGTLIRTSMKPSISSCAKPAADGLIAVILAACSITRDRIACRRKIESTRVNPLPFQKGAVVSTEAPSLRTGI